MVESRGMRRAERVEKRVRGFGFGVWVWGIRLWPTHILSVSEKSTKAPCSTSIKSAQVDIPSQRCHEITLPVPPVRSLRRFA